MTALLPHLKHSKSDILRKIGEQISQGRGLAKKVDNVIFGIGAEEVSKEQREWSDHNLNLLTWSFVDDSVATGYLRAGGGSLSEKVGKRLDYLRTIVNKFEFLDDPSLGNDHKPGSKGAELGAIGILDRLCHAFPLMVKKLEHRHDNRPALVKDEYDVQDLMHGLLMIFFDDIRVEEWTPSYAGGSSRMDFLLKKELTVFETKYAGPHHGSKEIGDELLIDIARYAKHPDCKRLVCMVYDPGGSVKNPRGLETDLSGEKSGFRVMVHVTPTWRH